VVVGPILILISFSYFGDATTDSRSIAIGKLKPVVTAWVDSGRSEFQSKKYSVTVGGKTQRAQAMSTGDSIADLGRVEHDSVRDGDWKPLRYSTSFLGSTGTNTQKQQLTVSLKEVSLGGGSSWSKSFAGCQTTLVDVQPCSMTCSSSSSSRRRRSSDSSSCNTCQSRCHSMGGSQATWVVSQGRGTCSVTVQLQSVTALVDKGVSSATGFALTLPAHTNGMVPQASHSSFATYAEVNSCTNIRPTVTVRSKTDPFVKAAMLTGFTLDFGSTPGAH
jgi:hypothetical protein